MTPTSPSDSSDAQLAPDDRARGDRGQSGGRPAEIDRLKAEIERLRSRVRRLQQENQQLRQEATIVRLYDDLADNVEPDDDVLADETAVEDRLYKSLPRRLTIREFFRRANDHGLEGEAARQVFVRLLRDKMIAQAGSRLEKSDSATGPSGD
jgi:hypothetical protein